MERNNDHAVLCGEKNNLCFYALLVIVRYRNILMTENWKQKA